MKKLLLLSLFSFSSLAQEYTLSMPTNSSFKRHSIHQFKKRLGPAGKELKHYYCNGHDEYNLFRKVRNPNLKKDSLKIELYKSKELITYREGKYYDAQGLETDQSKEIFMKYVVPALVKIEAVKEGAMLLRNLETSPYPLTIRFGGNRFLPDAPHSNANVGGKGIYEASTIMFVAERSMTTETTLPFQNIGAGGFINWEANNKNFIPHITLAHEMYHAFDGIRGMLDRRLITSRDIQNTEVAEIRAAYFDNIIRKASGLPYATHYADEKKGPGILTWKGEPIFIPAPCI